MEHHHHESHTWKEYLAVEVKHPRLVILLTVATFLFVGLVLGWVIGKDTREHHNVSDASRRVSE